MKPRVKPKYHISLGGEHKIFTLWYHYVIDNGYTYRDVYRYVQNLAIDPDEAYKKAKKIAGNQLVVWDVDEDKSILNKNRGIKYSNKQFDGITLTWGLKFNGQKISDIVNDEFGIKYLAFGYGFPNKPRQCDLDCLAYTSNHPKVIKYLNDLEDSKKKKEELNNYLIDTLKASEHIGVVGDSINIDVTIVDAKWINGYYGSTFLIKMIDNECNSITCFTTSKSFTDLKVHDELEITGIIKKHDIRDEKIYMEEENVTIPNVKSTLITRIKKVGGK